MSIKFISDRKKEELFALAKPHLLDVINRFHNTKKSGRNWKADCPICTKEDGLKINIEKDLVKCFKCGTGAPGASGYLMKFRRMEFLEAVEWLANFLNFDITDEPVYTHSDHKGIKSSTTFRNTQLRASGIPDEAQKWITEDGVQGDRYTAGTLDKYGNIAAGNDMLLHYVDLDGKPTTYLTQRGKKTPYVRIRFQIPQPDKDNNLVRYKSPFKSGNHLWIPEGVRKLFTEKQKLSTLIIIEGEKKADALTCRGAYAVGISGILNFATADEMPSEFLRLITDCQIEKVLFILDSDYQDLGSKLDVSAEARPRNFYLAVKRYREYFESYIYGGHPLNIYIGYGLDTKHKGLDDLLTTLPADYDINADIQDALHNQNKRGEHIGVKDITEIKPGQIMKIFNLDSAQSFMKYHEKVLKDLPKFRYDGLEYKYNTQKREFELFHNLTPAEQYWIESEDKKGNKEIKFNYINIRHFMRNHGFGKMKPSKRETRYVQIKNNVIHECDVQEVKEYVIKFTEALNNPPVLQKILEGNDHYLGPNRLINMYNAELNHIIASPHVQYFFFADNFWKITADEITHHPYNELPGQIWYDDIIKVTDGDTGKQAPFSATLLDPLFEFKFDDEDPNQPIIEPADIYTEDRQEVKIDIMEYFRATSDFLHRNEKLDEMVERTNVMYSAMADKMIAAGYILSSYNQPSQQKAVICYDHNNAPTQEGGTGKSIFSTMFEHIIPTVVIAADQADLTDDKFLYENVDDRTRLIVYDDCRRNLDFGGFKSSITRGVTKNAKGVGKYFIGLKRQIFNTNFVIKGEDRSYLRRQHPIGFGDYFNENHSPRDEFGHDMFTEWDYNQWNYFFNFMARCLQLYLKHGLRSFASMEDLKIRRLRDDIGEDLLDFLEKYWYPGSEHINYDWTLDEIVKAAHNQYQGLRKWLNARTLKARIVKYCQYTHLTLNPNREGHQDKRYRKNGTEYVIIADAEYDISNPKYDLEKPGFN